MPGQLTEQQGFTRTGTAFARTVGVPFAFAQRRHRPGGETGQLGTQAEKLAAHWVPNMKGAALGKFPAEILQKTKRLRAWAATSGDEATKRLRAWAATFVQDSGVPIL